jgi:hypothetical protein
MNRDDIVTVVVSYTINTHPTIIITDTIELVPAIILSGVNKLDWDRGALKHELPKHLEKGIWLNL